MAGGTQFRKTCDRCGEEIVMQKTQEGWKALNKDFTPHNCRGKSSGAAPANDKKDWRTGKLVSYGGNQAVLILEDLKEHTFALRSEIQRAWASAEYLMPVNNHPDVWLFFGKDAQGFILQGAEKVTPAPWASKLADPTGGAVTPVQKKSEPAQPPTETCTSPAAAQPEAPILPGNRIDEFKDLLLSTNRDGIIDLIKYLEESTDFFIAPSSTKYHDAEMGGLLRHSLKTYRNLLTLSKVYSEDYEQDAMIIIALLHDICKVNTYKLERKSLPRRDEKTGELVLDDFGKKIWDEQLVYTVDDQYPLGHGEKSVIMLQRFIQLTDTEIFAIRWHMMAYDNSRNSYEGNLAITNASDKYRIIPLFHMADLAASFLEMRPVPQGVQ